MSPAVDVVPDGVATRLRMNRGRRIVTGVSLSSPHPATSSSVPRRPPIAMWRCPGQIAGQVSRPVPS